MNNNAKILVVDDEKGIVDTLKEFLSSKGYAVNGAGSGEEALEIMDKDAQDLVLLDIRMPGLQGTEVARIIKDKHPKTKVIIITGYPQDSQRLINDRILEDVMIKPFKLESLSNRLQDILNVPREENAFKEKKDMEARVLLIKAKLLFIEPDEKVYNFLASYFKCLGKSGEDYQMELARDTQDAIDKAGSFKPDIIVANSEFMKGSGLEFFMRLSEGRLYPNEVIAYNMGSGTCLLAAELEKLVKSVEAACFMNGLIDIKWIDI